ncbi:Acyl-CoA N-acyltransferase [Naviculisporaceae sp. PSN 640]
MRALTLTPTIAVRSSAQQTRCFSQSTFHNPQSCQRACCRPTIVARSQASKAVTFQSQQTRGMKVHSSIKKRCEHCKECSTNNVCNVAISFKLGSHVLLCLLASRWVLDSPCSSNDGSIKCESSRSQEELKTYTISRKAEITDGTSVTSEFLTTMTSKKRKAAPEEEPFNEAYLKSDSQFIADYLTAKWFSEWTHPGTGDKYAIEMVKAPEISPQDLQACFDLIKETSQQDYESSRDGWHPAKKKIEMKSPELRYVLVKDKSNTIRGFTSLMPTFEEGQPVIYCYEIHLKPELHGTGLASQLMGFHAEIAQNLPPITKIMLTVFLANQRALKFYKKLGFEEDPISPGPRKLRFGKIVNPDYMIMSKRVRANDDSDDTK